MMDRTDDIFTRPAEQDPQWRRYQALRARWTAAWERMEIESFFKIPAYRPLEEATRRGTLAEVQAAWAALDVGERRGIPSSCLENAGGRGDQALAMVQYLHAQGMDSAGEGHGFIAAANSGNLKVMKYFCDRAPVGAGLLNFALQSAAGQNLENTRFIYEQGGRSDQVVYKALAVDNLPVVRYLEEQGEIAARNFRALFIEAAGYGAVAVLADWCGRGLADEKMLADAAENVLRRTGARRIETMRILCAAGVRVTDRIMIKAAAGGDVPLLRYLHEEQGGMLAAGGPDGDELMRQAALYGHAAVGAYLEDRGVRPAPPHSPHFPLQIAHYRQWEKKYGHSPQGLETLSPFYFRADSCGLAAAALEAEGYDGAARNHYAYQLGGLFRTPQRVMDYLEKWGDPNSQQPLHDIAQVIALPQDGRFNIAAWADAVLRHGPKMARLVKFAGTLQEPLRDAQGQWSYNATRNAVAQFAYRGAEDYPAELAGLCMQFNWSAENFNDAAQVVRQYEGLKRYEGAQPEAQPGVLVPAVDIDGALFGKPDYRFYKLPAGDVRGLFLGEMTACCQHLAGQGADCAAYGFIAADSGFYVMAHKKTDEIVAQSWAWRGLRGELVLDSLEALPGHVEARQWTSLCREFAARVQGQAGITAVHVGTGGATPPLPFGQMNETAIPVAYDSYRDSYEQYHVTRFDPAARWVPPV